ncbi:amino acid adenylation domain-containing protein [Burkholderia glumae]|uniref:amino acid adenylation domain-containing protein n=1 Tax=Burkholderia glumae TaxID=337 RepID=UPI002036898A|nr:amino acid adenylation domain-containing protein [Burkholderia glumae]MCM2547151.1 amino acid adenylation domain-containing protein [Burkholderia glumae]
MNAHTTTPSTHTPPPLDLPRDYPAPVTPRYRRMRHDMAVPAAAAEAVGVRARQDGYAETTLWLAALGMTLARYADQRSVPLDLITCADARSEPARTRLTLDVAPAASADVLFRATRDALDQRTPHDAERMPASVTASFTGLPADLAVAALTEAALDDADVLFVDSEVNFMLIRRADALLLECDYDEDRYEAATIAGMLTSWLGAATALADAVATPVGELPLWPAHALAAWRDTLRGPVAEIPDLTVSALIREAAERAPDAIAVETATQRLSYRELLQRAARVARALRARGVQPGERVAVCVERRVDLLSALLGVMTAGCAYVPLDPGYPAARRDFILENADVRLVIAEATADGAHPQVTLDALLEGSAGDDASTDFSDGDPAAIAYVIYTSGSTGQPKGVRVAHRAAVNLLLAMLERSGLQTDETWLAVTTPMFDIAFAELFVPLVAGGRVWLASRDETADPLALASRIEEARVRVLQATPATWRLLIASQWRGKHDLTAVCGGEALDQPLAHALRPLVGRLCNVYGPTEATVWATWHEVRDHGFVAIGTPLRNVQLHILDAHGAPVPPGVAGELYIGGAGLADGYHGRDSLTRDRFVEMAFDGDRAVRLYRTGDLVRASASGAIRWLARLDNQVKLRGFRIELGDVEAALAALPGVRQAVAMVERLDEHDQRLVAYVVHDEGAAADRSAQWREGLRRTLPDYMIPAGFVPIERVPLTDNGKVDRNRLPALTRAASSAPQAAAHGSTLERVQAIWRDVLRTPEVGVDINFFDLGGHSVLLLQMQQKIEQAFGTRVPRIEFFRNPTVAGLAAYLDARGKPAGAVVRPCGRGRGETPVGSASVAVVGIGVRVPGASSVDAFWRNLREGVESRTEFSEAELREAGVSPALLADPNFVRAGFVLDDIDQFDATFFGMSPREAELLDPQQRIFLECAWQALEDAGIDPQKEGDRIGVFAGSDASGYHKSILAPLESDSAPAAAFQIRISNEKDHLPTRVSYRLNLHGPSVNVQTACSTSLVAVHLAAQSLLRGECDGALAGGVCIHVPHRIGYLYQEGMVASPDGHCRAFDRQGAGTVFGSGAGVVVLKRLDDALAAGDRIYAVVKGTAINNDGSGKVGYTAPSVDGQAAAIMEAHAVAGVDPRAIGYVEAHGTATPLGDPIEIAALTQAFRASTEDTGFCAIGSVKTNIGHLDQAAGVAGLIKAVLTVFHGEIPPSLHCTQTNPDIPFDASPFFVNTQLRAWSPEGGVRVAGVSSFGIGGTNAHAILESVPEVVREAAIKVALPTYPFQRKRYWVDASQHADVSAHRHAASEENGLHTLLGRRLKLPRSAEVRFEAEFRPDWPAYVDHHRLFGAMVVPGASHIAMFLAAAEAVYGEAGCVVDEILFLRPFVMPEAGRRSVQIVMRPAAGQSHAIEMVTLAPQRDPADDAAWTLHVEARSIRGPRALPPAPDASELEGVKARCADYLSGADFYSKVWIPGMDTGNSFRWIDEIWRGDAEALCRTRLPALLEPIDGPFHAGLVESGFQLLNSCWQFATEELLKTDYIYVPFSIDSYRLYGRPTTDRLWVHARIVRQGEGEENGVTADIRVFEDSGRVIAHVRGFEVRRLHRSAVHTLLQGDGTDRLFAPRWQRLDDLVISPLPADDCVLIAGDGAGAGAALAARLRGVGVRCLRIDAASHTSDELTVALADPASEAAWRDTLRAAAARAGQGTLQVVDLRALDLGVGAEVPADALAVQAQLCGGALALVGALTQVDRPVRVNFITRGAQEPGGTLNVERAAQATLIGLARVVAAEHPEWGCRTIDLDPATADPAAALAPLLHAAPDELQLAIRDGAVHAARLGRVKPARRDAPSLESNGSYLITGGLGGLGLRLAQQLAKAGVKRLVLMSRGAPDAAATTAIDALRQLGCTVDLARCDVADPAAMRLAWHETVLSGPFPLKGIFHAAGALRDGVLGGQSWAEFAVPLHAKVAGALNLHALSLDAPLDCFVCFSSISALFGTAGQANYAAANAYLDALVGARRTLGLPATSIQWGPFAEVGMAASLDRAHRDKATARGLQLLAPDELLKHIEAARRADVATVVIGNDDWQRYAQTEPSEGVRKLLADWLPTEAADTARVATHDERDRFDALALPALRYALAIYLQAQIAVMLGRSAEEVAPTRGFLELGLDSLAAVEFRSKVQRDLRLSLPATFAFDYGNVELGADFLFERLKAARAPAADEAVPAAGIGSPEPAAAEAVDDVDAELARLEASLRR